MNGTSHIDADALADEVARYLAAVDAFRAANCEPTWRPELPAIAPAAVVLEAARAAVERNVH